MSFSPIHGIFPLLKCSKLIVPAVSNNILQKRWRDSPKFNVLRKRDPFWYLPQYRKRYKEDLTSDNVAFIKEMVHEKYGPPSVVDGLQTIQQTPLKSQIEYQKEKPNSWFPGCRRSGLIALKIGIYPQWDKTGRRFQTTLLQIVDNHVISYMGPGEFQVNRKKQTKRFIKENIMGCLVVGAMGQDPQLFTKEYCGLFAKVGGILPKKHLTRFIIHPEAALAPGTPLTAAHFRVGDAVDVTGRTVDRGFQGVMKRWGFHGQPATHGQTKTHRRPGNIGAGGEKGRVWPGKKMPGHMGNRTRTLKGLKIWRINHQYNVIYVTGQNVPGNTNSFVYIHDTILPLRRLQEPPPFPTYFPDETNPRPIEEFDEKLFNLDNPSIEYPDVKVTKKK